MREKLSASGFPNGKQKEEEKPIRSCLRSILYAMHTLSRGTLALTLKCPLGRKEANSVRLMPRTDRGSGRSKRSPKSILCPEPTLEPRNGRFKGRLCVVLKTGRKMAQPRKVFRGCDWKNPVDKRSRGGRITLNKATAFPNSKLVEKLGS